MSNTYFKIMNQNSKKQFTENLINEIKNEVRQSSFNIKNNLYDSIYSINTKHNDLNSLLRYYLLNQIIKDTDLGLHKSTLIDTTNPKIKKDAQGNYYKLNKNEYVQNPEIININDDGSYVVETKQESSLYTIRKVVDINETTISIQLINPKGNIEKNLVNAVAILGMRKEYALKFKYSGYSGNSNDLAASLLNKLYPPVETGYYMDKQYNFFRWNPTSGCFVHNPKYDSKSPMLTDYNFEKANGVIRKEYTGK